MTISSFTCFTNFRGFVGYKYLCDIIATPYQTIKEYCDATGEKYQKIYGGIYALKRLMDYPYSTELLIQEARDVNTRISNTN